MNKGWVNARRWPWAVAVMSSKMKWIGLKCTVHCTYRLNWARRMVRWMRWHSPPDTGFETRALAVRGRARYLSVTEVLHNTEFHTWKEKKHFVSLKPPTPGTEPRTLAWKAAVLTTTLGPPPVMSSISSAAPAFSKRWTACRVDVGQFYNIIQYSIRYVYMHYNQPGMTTSWDVTN